MFSLKTALKIVSIALTVAIFIPTATKIAHVLENETHEICEGGQLKHYHELEIDCDFKKFNLNKAFQTEFFKLDTNHEDIQEQEISSTQQFFYGRSWDTFLTRGPPVMV